MKFVNTACSALILSASCFTGIANAGLITDPLENNIVTVGNLDWAWASPCDGGCSQLVENWEYANGVYTDEINAQLGVSTWRYATLIEWESLPSVELFSDENKCASAWFDIQYSHCDYTHLRVRQPTGINSETMLVRINGLAVVDVPEPSTFAIFALGIMGLAARRYTKAV